MASTQGITRREFNRAAAAGFLWLGFKGLGAFAGDEEEFFTLVVLPDTQYDARDRIEVSTFSPYLDRWATETDNRFELPYSM